jgi:hypothetical protein
MSSAVVEIVTFSLAEGVTNAEFLATVDAVSQWARNQPGFISRDLAFSESDGRWMDMIWWKSQPDALAAADAIITSEACGAMMSLLDESSIVMMHATPAIPHASA